VAEIRAGPSGADRELAMEKLHFVESVAARARAGRIPEKVACALVASEDLPAFDLLVRSGKRGASSLTYPNFRNWKRLLQAAPAGPDRWRALCPRYVGARTYQRPGPDAFWGMLCGMYEHPNQVSLHACYEYTVAALQRMAGAEPLPTYPQVRHYYATQVDRKRILIARHGEEWYRNHLAGYIRREAPRVDEVWVGDHHIFDAAVRVWDEAAGRWLPVRPWLTAWFDWGSWAFVGWQIRAIYPNRDSIERALRDGIAKNGGVPPVYLYIDNGRDYRAMLGGGGGPLHYFRNEAHASAFRSVAGGIRSKVTFATPYNARAKVIERSFKDVCGRFSKLFLSYRGSNPVTRPEHAGEEWDNPERLPTLQDFAARFDSWITSFFNEHPSAAKGRGGKLASQVRSASARLREPLGEMDLYKAFLRDLGEREIQRGGVVTAIRRSYRSDALWTLYGQVQSVNVRVDPDDVSRVWLFTTDGREIGPATEIRTLAPMAGGPSDGDRATTIEAVREETKLERRRARALRADSAEARALPVFRRSPQLPAGPGAGIQAGSAAALPAACSRPATASPLDGIEVSEADVADLDAILRDETRERLAEMDEFAGGL
jgi:hypothetical protein